MPESRLARFKGYAHLMQLETASYAPRSVLPNQISVSPSVLRDALSDFLRCESEVNLWLLRTEPGGVDEQDQRGGIVGVSASKTNLITSDYSKATIR